MKHLFLALTLLASMFTVATPAVAAPLVCSGPTGLVYVLSASCAAANVGVLPGFTVGQCLVVQADFSLGGGACGGGGASLTATQTFTGVNTFSNGPTVFGNAAVGNQVNLTLSNSANPITVITDGSGSCDNVVAVSALALREGPFLLGGFDVSSDFCSIGYLYGTAGVYAGSSGGGFVDTSGNSAAMHLGQSGAPSGACVSGSIYTRSDGGAGTTLYGCYSSTWHAATTP